MSEIDRSGEAARRALEEARRQVLARETATAARVRQPASAPQDTVERSRGFGPFDARTPTLRELAPAALAASSSLAATPRLRGEWTPRVERLPWHESAPGLAEAATASVRQKLSVVADGVVKTREALWSQPDRNARVRYGAELAGEHLDRVLEKWRGVQDTAARYLAPAAGGLWQGLREARRELSLMREDAASAGRELREVAGWATSRGVNGALGEILRIEQAARSAEGELRFVGGRAAILYSAADPAFPAPEAGAASPGPEAAVAEGESAAVSALAPDFTEADLARLGSGLDPAQPPVQTLWNENQVNLVSAEGRKQGGITEAQGAENAELARQALSLDAQAAGQPLELTAADLAAVLKKSGLALETVDPNQVVAATRYLNTATTLADQQEKLRKTLDNFQTLARIGLPRLPREQLMGQLDTHAKVPGKASAKLSERDLQAKFQEIAATLNAGGTLQTKVGQYNLKLEVSEQGQLTQTSCKKPGFFSKMWSAVKKVAPIALTALSFVPVTAPFARIAQGVISAVKAIQAKSLLGVATAAAGIVAGGAAAFASKTVKIAGTVANRVANVANAAARGLQGVSAIKQGNALGGLANIGGAVASGIGGFAATAGDRLDRLSKGLGDASDKLLKAATGVSAARDYQQASQDLSAARQALVAARASGNELAIAQATKRLDAAERAKQAALFSGVGSAAMVAADLAGQRRTPGTGQAQDRPAAASGLEAGLRAASRGLSAAGNVARRDWEGVGVDALGAAAALKSGQRPKADTWRSPAEQQAAAELERLLGRRARTSTLNDLSNLADAGRAYRQSEQAEQAANQAVADAERVLQAARGSGNPAAIREAEAQLRTARRGAEGALMGGIGAADSLLGTASHISDQHRLARAEKTAVERLASAIGLKGLLEQAEGETRLSPRDQNKASGLRVALEVLDRNYKTAVAAAAGDPRRLAELNDQYADFLGKITGEIPAVRVASLGVRDSEGTAPAAASRSTMSLADQRRSAAIVLENDRARIEADLERSIEQFRATSGWLPEDSDRISSREAFRSASDRLAAVLGDPASSEADLTQARLDQHLARLAFDQARSPKRSDPDPILAGLSGFLDEAGSRAFALVTLGGSVGIDRAQQEGRLTAQSGPAEVFQAYLEGVFNGITFGGAEAFVNARAGEGKGLGASLAAGFQQLGSSAIALEELAILADPKKSSWEKSEAGASLVAKWAGLAAGGVAGGRAARARFEAWRSGRAVPAPPPPPVETPKTTAEAEAAARTQGAEAGSTIAPNSGTSSGSPTGQTWTAAAPVGPKPRIGEPGAAEWRYQRYLHEQSAKGKSPAEVLSRDEWIERYFNPTASGGRPGRSGGPEQVAAKRVLQDEGIRIVENVQLGGRYPDGIRPKPNAHGGTDYFEVGRMLDNGLPEARERVKLVDELRALHPKDTVTFVDRSNPAKRITYGVEDLARLLATLRHRK